MDAAQNAELQVAMGLRARRGMTWTPTAEDEVNSRNAVVGAIDLLRSIAGNPDLSFEAGDDLDLCITCAWYLIENRRAEFMKEYISELTWLRIRETTKNGTG